MAGSKNFMDNFKGKDIKQIMYIIELLLTHLEPLCITLWLAGISTLNKELTESEWFSYKEEETLDAVSYINKTDKAIWWCGLTGGLVFAFGMFLRLFPIVNQSSGYLKLSGLVMILTTVIYLFIQKDYDSPSFKGSRDLMHKPLFIVNLVTVSILTLNSLFTLQYYTM